MIRHDCKPEEKIGRDLCFSGYGVAIGSGDIFWDEECNCWLIGNGEYYSEIFYCPWCGEELEQPNAE